jgi:hypothetical protein
MMNTARTSSYITCSTNSHSVPKTAMTCSGSSSRSPTRQRRIRTTLVWAVTVASFSVLSWECNASTATAFIGTTRPMQSPVGDRGVKNPKSGRTTGTTGTFLARGGPVPVLPCTSRTRSLTLATTPATCTRLHAASTSISTSTPSQSESEALGIREWPQQAKKRGTFSESCGDGQTLVRYILEGTATVNVQTTTAENVSQSAKLSVGTLMEVQGPCQVDWDVTSEELILLTPGFEQGGSFAAVLGLLVLVCGVLLSGAV